LVGAEQEIAGLREEVKRLQREVDEARDRHAADHRQALDSFATRLAEATAAAEAAKRDVLDARKREALLLSALGSEG